MYDPNDNKSDSPETSVMSPEVAAWYSSYDGYSNADAAKDTGVSESEAAEAGEAAAGDSEDTN